jgi:anti-anti-sigma factor
VGDFQVTQLDGQKTGLRLVGELDLLTAPMLMEAYEGINGNGQVTIDLSELTFIDSGGLHAIASIVAATNGNGPLIMEGASAMVRRLFEITNLADHPKLEIR